MSHTTGNWTRDGQHIVSGTRHIATIARNLIRKRSGITTVISDAQDIANARLITAAPRLLSALCGLMEFIPEDAEFSKDRFTEARAAIYQATGKPTHDST